MFSSVSAAQEAKPRAAVAAVDLEAANYDEDTDFYSDLDDYSYSDDQYSYGTDTSNSFEETSEAQGNLTTLKPYRHTFVTKAGTTCTINILPSGGSGG